MSKIKLSLSNIYSYEEYQVLCVLEKLAPGEEDLRPQVLKGFAYPPDFYISKGIESLGLIGETVVETKHTLSFSALKYMEAYFGTHSQNGYNLMVVFFKNTLSNIPSPKTLNGKQMIFVPFDDLKKMAKVRFLTEEKYYLDNAKKTDWKDLRCDIVKEASDIVSQGNNVLFLGAGVSMSAKMPSWSTLLKNLLGEVKMLKGDSLKAFTELDTHVYSECGDSNLIMARYLETAIKLSDKNADYMQLIQKNLYSKEHSSDLLTDLALVVKGRKVDEVITYNFDDILEQELINNGLKDSKHFTSIARDAEVTDHNNLPIYHVHGIIPEHGNTVDTVVFSEAEYHDRYRNAYHWSNIEQLHALMRKHCFFVGLSMQDPNLRRLLDIARRMNSTDKPSHYAILQRKQQEKYCLSDQACKYIQVSQSLIDKKKQKDIYDLNYTVLEDIYRELGVNVIWYESHEEIPVLIEQIFGVKRILSVSTIELKQKVEALIKQIKGIENKAPKYSPANLTVDEYVNFIEYAQTYGNDYRSLVIECGDILQELSNRVDFNIPNNLQKLVNNSVKYDNLNGYADLFGKWYDNIKSLKEKGKQ